MKTCQYLFVVLIALSTVTSRADQAAVASTKEAQTADSAELAKKLSNPVANLISVPFQNNWDWGIGDRNAMKYTLNFQPVVPIGLTEDYNLIIRTILPFIYAEKPVAGGKNRTGLGDATQSFFLSPKKPVGGWILGAGPVGYWPTATDDALGAEKWGAGPTVVALRQAKGWTVGVLGNWIWSYADSGSDDRPYVNSTFLQPFLTYTTRKATSFALNTESTYDWNDTQWTVPLNLTVSQIIKVGKMPVQLQFGGRLYVERPADGPNWGLRFAITPLFPKR